MAETEIMKKCMVRASALGRRLFRNNVALAWVSSFKPYLAPAERKVIMQRGDVLLKQGRPLHAGLRKGSSDLIGWETVTITPAMVGLKIAVFTGCEVKDKGSLTQDQKDFLHNLKQAGGIAIVARTPEDVDRRAGVDKQDQGIGI